MLPFLAFGTFVSITTTHALKTIVVGSGPGGTGFIKRALDREDCDDTFEWLEEGGNNVILDWPVECTAPDSSKYIKLIDRTTSDLMKAVRFSGFGGGATRNSGGPLTLIPSEDHRIQAAIDKYGQAFLEEELQSPPTTDSTSEQWIQRYAEAGYEVEAPHFMTERQVGQSNRVGYGATTFDGKGTRTQVAKTLLTNDRVQLHLNSHVKRVIFGAENRAEGVELEDGTVVNGDRVVLAAGVFGTYEILVRSGIGSQQDLDTIDVEPVVIDDSVGQNIGDDSGILFLHKGGRSESNEASHGADVIATHGNEYAITHWGKVAYDALLLGSEIRLQSGSLNNFFRNVLDKVSIVKIDLPATYTSSLSMRKDGTMLYDDIDQHRKKLCVENEEYGILKQSGRPPLLIKAAASIMNVLYANPGKRCGSGQLLSNFHYHGGSQGVTKTDFSVKQTKGLYISDASATDGYTFGAPTTNVYMIGHAAADAIYGSIGGI